MSKPARVPVPGEHRPELLTFHRRMSEMGIHVPLPAPDPRWDLPEPLPIDADEVSRIVVELREQGRL